MNENDAPPAGSNSKEERTASRERKIRAAEARRNQRRSRRADAKAEELPGSASHSVSEPELREQTQQAQKIAGPARLKGRHRALYLSFFLWVLAPLAVVVWYLYFVALDQYASYAGFTVRTEEVSSGIEVLGGITDLSGSSAADTDILYKFIQGRRMIEAAREQLDLQAIYGVSGDPAFALRDNATIEDIQDYWPRVVKVYYDTRSNLLEIRVVAFSPEDAQAVAQLIMAESTSAINELTAIARSDTTRYAKDELDNAIERLKEARSVINAFRARTQIVDPFADTQGHLGLLNNLQAQLATALIELDLIRQTAGETDPRVRQGERKVQVIRNRISEERNRFGSVQDTQDDTYSKLVGEYEALAVDLEFANQSYLSSLAAYDTALAEARRKSRYLAAYVSPTRAETAEYPKRLLLTLLIGGGLLLSWMIAMLIYYSVRDRR